MLLKAIAELPPRQREVIVLRDIQGYSAEEARNALDLWRPISECSCIGRRSKVRAALEATSKRTRPWGRPYERERTR